jgi:methyl-accepting chemotaxis protein
MNKFKNLNAKPKLFVAFGVMLSLILGISYLAVDSLTQANERVLTLYDRDMKGLSAADGIVIDRMSLGRQGRDAILNIRNPAIVAADAKVLDTTLTDLANQIDEFDNKSHTAQGKALVATFRSAFPAYSKAYRDLAQAALAKNLRDANAALDAANTTGKPLYKAADDARAMKITLGQEKIEGNQAAFTAARATVFGLAGVSILLAAALSFVIASGFSGPLGRAVEALERVADGDLTASLDVETKDEVGRMAAALNLALERLRSTLREVADGAASASASSHQMATASESIASGAQQQAASLEETSASLEEITATVRQSADNAKQASQLANGSRDAAERGQGVVSTAVAAMTEINLASSKISNIISTIDEIAFQTNLLTVNAAVEAARAGDEGRGFAVVASEVRGLAQRSAGAAKEIKALIHDSLSKVERGMELVNRSGETLQGIVGSVKRVTDIVTDITVAAQEQSSGIEQVNTAMSQMDQVTQSNSAHTEELSATAQALSEQSLHLLTLVNGFKLGDEGKAFKAAGVPAAPARKPHLKINFSARTLRAKKVRTAMLAPVPVVAARSAESTFKEL